MGLWVFNFTEALLRTSYPLCLLPSVEIGEFMQFI